MGLRVPVYMKFFHCLEIASILPFHNPYKAVYSMLRNLVSLCRPLLFSFFVAGIEESYHEIGRLGSEFWPKP